MVNAKECEAMRSRLQRFSDGELGSEESREIRSHLLDCMSCRSIVGQVISVRKFFETPPPPAPPRDFAARVAALAFAGGPAGSTTDSDEETILPFVRRIAAVAAAALLLAGATLWMNSGRGRASGLLEIQAGTQLEKEIEQIDRDRAEKAAKRAPEANADPRIDANADLKIDAKAGSRDNAAPIKK